MEKFFDGLSDDQKLVLQILRGPTWSPEKKFKKIEEVLEDKKTKVEENINTELKSVQQASKDSVRAIMLIRALELEAI